MKVVLTLKASSMLFFSKINLLRGQEVEVELKDLTLADRKLLNKYIKGGAVVSSIGELPIEAEEPVTPAVDKNPVTISAQAEIEATAEVIVEGEKDVKEEVLVEPVEEKKVTKRTTKKKAE